MNYKIVCRTREGAIVWSAENLTLAQAEEHAAMFNDNSEIQGTGHHWVVEPMRYH
jgi:hypothetical protein